MTADSLSCEVVPIDVFLSGGDMRGHWVENLVPGCEIADVDQLSGVKGWVQSSSGISAVKPS